MHYLLKRRLPVVASRRSHLCPQFPFLTRYGPTSPTTVTWRALHHLWSTWDANRKATAFSPRYVSTAVNTQPEVATAGSTGQRITQMEFDFFGEPVSFIDCESSATSNAMAAMDGLLLCVVSKGKSCSGGGEEGGLEVKSAHSAALAWAEALRHAAVWNPPPLSSLDNTNNVRFKSAPMLVAVAVAPVLAQTGIAYVKHLDTLLKHTKARVSGLPPIQMYDLAMTAVNAIQDEKLAINKRERMHLTALNYLVLNEHPSALNMYLRILRMCPGDALAISLAMDLCCSLGDKQSALRAVGSVSSYWNERRGGLIQPAIPGHAMVSSLMALGFAVSGRDEDAEQMAERAMKQGRSVCGGLATWAQVHVFDARGRIAEGISACANFDGVANYEGSGFLFFDCRLGGYGARFSLDREERGRGKSAALRLYEANFERVLGYSGFSQGQAWKHPRQRAPLAWTETLELDGSDTATPSFFNRMLGRKSKPKEELNYELVIKQINVPSTQYDGWEPSCEDVLTWLPPTPAFLSDATLLLLRFTLNGTISARNARWDNVRNGWSAMLDIQRKHATDLTFAPLLSVVASLLYPPSETGGDQIGDGRLAEGLHLLGELLQLGNPITKEEKNTSVRELIADNDPNFWLPVKEANREAWKKVVDHLASAIEGSDDGYGSMDGTTNLSIIDVSARFQAWDFEARPIFEHAICYAACKSGDTESLCLARSICSQGVTLRPNAPEEWWRYSIVLGLLGDDVGSEDALSNSINFGSGQGARS